jgi:adenylyl cyclase-associated protein
MSSASGAASQAAAPAAKSIAVPPSIEAYDSLINEEVEPWVNLSKKLGGILAEQVGVSCVLQAAGMNEVGSC